jgi:hypothetical protein
MRKIKKFKNLLAEILLVILKNGCLLFEEKGQYQENAEIKSNYYTSLPQGYRASLFWLVGLILVSCYIRKLINSD